MPSSCLPGSRTFLHVEQGLPSAHPSLLQICKPKPSPGHSSSSPVSPVRVRHTSLDSWYSYLQRWQSCRGLIVPTQGYVDVPPPPPWRLSLVIINPWLLYLGNAHIGWGEAWRDVQRCWWLQGADWEAAWGGGDSPPPSWTLRQPRHWSVPNVTCFGIRIRRIRKLKVVTNEKWGESRSWQMFEGCTRPWRSMSVYFFMKPPSFLQRISVSGL